MWFSASCTGAEAGEVVDQGFLSFGCGEAVDGTAEDLVEAGRQLYPLRISGGSEKYGFDRGQSRPSEAQLEQVVELRCHCATIVVAATFEYIYRSPVP